MPGHAWLRHHPEPDFDMAKLEVAAESHCTMIQAMSCRLEMITSALQDEVGNTARPLAQ